MMGSRPSLLRTVSSQKLRSALEVSLPPAVPVPLWLKVGVGDMSPSEVTGLWQLSEHPCAGG